MSASSSSECECDYYNNYRTYTPIQPLYPELGHPLIYFAQVQKKPRTQQSERVKNNCFVKAFRWYTEERVPLKKIESGTNNEDVQGFAAWLDQKYDEYIRKNQTTQIASPQCFKQTSMARTTKLAQNVAYETSGPRNNKMKSPWRRRQNYSKNNGDSIKKSDQSIEIILNAKSLSRSASECCQKCHRSNTAINVDGNKPKTLKSKSESIIYILKEEEMYVVPYENSNTVTERKNGNDDKIYTNNEQLNKRHLANDTSCQCSIIKLEKVDASSQFSQNKTSNVCGCVKSYTNLTNDKMTYFNTCCPCTESHSGMCRRILKEEQTNLPTVRPSAASQKSIPNTHSAIVRETSFFANKYIGKNEPSFSVNGIAQTSDHAINLSNVINPEYPIFLKIICADNYKNNFI